MQSFTRSVQILGFLAVLAAGCADEGCPVGFVDLGGTCIDVYSDPGNCGSFGNACPSGQPVVIHKVF